MLRDARVSYDGVSVTLLPAGAETVIRPSILGVDLLQALIDQGAVELVEPAPEPVESDASDGEAAETKPAPRLRANRKVD